MSNLKFASICAILLFILPWSALYPEHINARVILTSAIQYYQYPDYDFQEPIVGFDLDTDIFNIYQNFGVGGRIFLKLYSYNDQFCDLRYYEGYIHNYFNRREGRNYFIYGFLGGIRKTYIYYFDLRENRKSEVAMIRPLAGFHFSKETFGATLKWTQTESKKSKFEYELKMRNNLGLIMQVGGSFKGPLTGIKSDFHIYVGYEFIL